MRVTRRYRFCASHRLHSPHLPEGDNAALYGKCNNPFGHGHNYVLEVTVSGPVQEQTGHVAPFSVLDELVDGQVLRAYDHRNLNTDLPEFQDGLVPTTENVAVCIEQRLRAEWRRAFPDGSPVLCRVRLHETRNNTFELSPSPQ